MSLETSGDALKLPRASLGKIGAILTRSGAATEHSIQLALEAQTVSRARLGDILSARGLAERADIAEAAARQHGMPFVDLAVEPADPTLFNAADLGTYLDHRIMPWRRVGARTVYLTSDIEEGAKALKHLKCKDSSRYLALTEARDLRNAMVSANAESLAQRAGQKRPKSFSLRKGASMWQKAGVGSIIVGFFAGLVLAPVQSLVALTYLVAVIIGLNGVLWLTSALCGRNDVEKPSQHDNSPQIADHRPPPRVSILIALYREAEVAPLLIEALRALNYPPELLDVKLILEADDDETGPALLAQKPPPFVEILVTPDGGPRTKPRALNFAMEFAKGDIIGVYDAEDRPHPEQIRQIAAQFAASPPEVACIQARLGFYNTSENFITRCFEIEYASWFDVMLPGLRRLGLPILLGGTSFFIRRGALAAAGGWDSYNVTEDADLGVMLARAGMQTALSRSLTGEEASSRPDAWIKQRSRWLKGYLATWITHMAEPVKLWRDLGAWRFIWLNVILLSAVLGYLALPFLWVGAVMTSIKPFGDILPGALAHALHDLGYVTAISISSMLVAAFLGLWRRGRTSLAPIAFLLPLYWPLGAAAAYLAIYELIVTPTSWRKTQHGVGRIAAEMRKQTLEDVK